jgi:hypothetical protein
MIIMGNHISNLFIAFSVGSIISLLFDTVFKEKVAVLTIYFVLIGIYFRCNGD